MKTIVDLPITITVADRASMERQLDEAVIIAQARAVREGRQGILVTRHDYEVFTVARELQAG